MPTTRECFEMGILIERCSCAAFHGERYFGMKAPGDRDIEQIRRLYNSMAQLFEHYSFFDQPLQRVTRLINEIMTVRTNRFNPEDRNSRDYVFSRFREIRQLFEVMNASVNTDICG